jgi:hypothetical protein
MVTIKSNQSQTRQTDLETLSRKILHENRAGGIAQGEGPEFKPQYHKPTKIFQC